MVRVKQPLTMRRLAIAAVAENIELIAYGPAASDCLSLRQINETETYLTMKGPFVLWRELCTVNFDLFFGVCVCVCVCVCFSVFFFFVSSVQLSSET